jgi:hypothetical protein
VEKGRFARDSFPMVFCLEDPGGARFVGGVLFAAPLSPMVKSLADYPDWFVVACLTIVAAVAIWIFAKLLKLTLWLVLVCVLVGGGAAALWLLWH